MNNDNAQPTPSMSFTEDTQMPMIELLTINDRDQTICESIEGDFKQNIHKTCKKHHIQKGRRHLTNGSEKNRVNNRKKINQLQRKIQQLQKELALIKRRYQCCPNCRYNLSENIFQNDIMIRQQQYLSNIAGSFDNRRNSKESLEFQKIDFTIPINVNPQMQQKSWIFLGTLMIVMGSKNLEVDGTINTFKIVKQAVDQVRRQVQKCQQKINLDFYHLKTDIKELDLIPGVGFDPFYSKQQPSGSLELDGVRVESVQEYELFYDRKISFSVKYQALITVMEYIKDHCSFT